jgi:hypothetical protein
VKFDWTANMLLKTKNLGDNTNKKPPSNFIEGGARGTYVVHDINEDVCLLELHEKVPDVYDF